MSHACPECNNIDPSKFSIEKNGSEVTKQEITEKILSLNDNSHAVANVVCDECGYSTPFSVTFKPS